MKLDQDHHSMCEQLVSHNTENEKNSLSNILICYNRRTETKRNDADKDKVEKERKREKEEKTSNESEKSINRHKKKPEYAIWFACAGNQWQRTYAIAKQPIWMNGMQEWARSPFNNVLFDYLLTALQFN